MAEADSGEVTGLLLDWSDGDEQALERLMPIVYAELHRIAGRHLRNERSEHTLQTTALVNEAYMRLIQQSRVKWHNRAHFFRIAAQMMRRVLVDYARKHQSAKRGGGQRAASVDVDAIQLSAGKSEEVVAVDLALTDLATFDPELARLVELRFFAGLTAEEIADLTETSTATVNRRWRLARAWLYRALARGEADED